MLLHWLVGLDSFAWQPHAYAYHNHHRDSDSHPLGDPILDTGWPIRHPQLASPHIDIYPISNADDHLHCHAHTCAIVYAVPAAYADVYSQLDAHSSHGDRHILPAAADRYLYPRSTHSDVYLITGASNCYLYSDSTDSDGNHDS